MFFVAVGKNFKKKGYFGKINCQDLGKNFDISQEIPTSWLENQDSKHWMMILRTPGSV